MTSRMHLLEGPETSLRRGVKTLKTRKSTLLLPSVQFLLPPLLLSRVPSSLVLSPLVLRTPLPSSPLVSSPVLCLRVLEPPLLLSLPFPEFCYLPIPMPLCPLLCPRVLSTPIMLSRVSPPVLFPWPVGAAVIVSVVVFAFVAGCEIGN